ncbi:MAG: GNAT family N-acetyltransferase [Rhodobacteraceae bacterium]|nr:GNAT family N-acetyltransferase [Paracoccaceae bacterium]
MPGTEIIGLYVDPAYQRRGVARALAAKAERRLFNQGTDQITAKVSPAEKVA